MININTFEKVTNAEISSDGTQFWAVGFDKDGNEYTIYWDILDKWAQSSDQDQEDASDACDWDNPVSVELI